MADQFRKLVHILAGKILNQFPQSRVAKKFAAQIRRLGNSVGIDHQEIIFLQLRRPIQEFGVGKKPHRKIRRLQRLQLAADFRRKIAGTCPAFTYSIAPVRVSTP